MGKIDLFKKLFEFRYTVFQKHETKKKKPLQKQQFKKQGEVANVLQCHFIESKFEFMSCYMIHFQTNTLGKRISPFILPTWDWITLPQSLLKNIFDIK